MATWLDFDLGVYLHKRLLSSSDLSAALFSGFTGMRGFCYGVLSVDRFQCLEEYLTLLYLLIMSIFPHTIVHAFASHFCTLDNIDKVLKLLIRFDNQRMEASHRTMALGPPSCGLGWECDPFWGRPFMPSNYTTHTHTEDKPDDDSEDHIQTSLGVE